MFLWGDGVAAPAVVWVPVLQELPLPEFPKDLVPCFPAARYQCESSPPRSWHRLAGIGRRGGVDVFDPIADSPFSRFFAGPWAADVYSCWHSIPSFLGL